MVRLTDKGKRLLTVGLALIVTSGIGAKLIYNTMNTGPAYLTEADNLDDSSLGEAVAEEASDIQVEPIRTRNDKCIFVEDTSLRISDNDNSKALKNVSVNDNCYRLFSTNTSYSLVRTGKYLGFVPTSSIESVVVNENDNTTYSEADGLALVNGCEVNFRSGPGTEYDSYGYINLNDGLELIAKSDKDWYLVRKMDVLGNITLGFISSDYVRKVTPEEFINGLPGFISAVVSTASNYTNVRVGNGENFEVIDKLKHGKSLVMLGRTDNGWYKVQLEDGREGYVSEQYVKPTYIVKNMDTYKTVGMKKDTYTYSPYGEIVGSLPKYEVGVVYREDNGYYLIRTYDGETCYVKKDDTKEMTDTCIIVDISDQKSYVLTNGKLMLTSPVSTGKDGTETRIGFGKLRSHEKSKPGNQIYLEDEAETYKIPVDYRMRIYWYDEKTGKWFGNGQCFHPYKCKYDGTRRSHGCIRTKYAGDVYQLTHVDDSVVVKR